MSVLTRVGFGVFPRFLALCGVAVAVLFGPSAAAQPGCEIKEYQVKTPEGLDIPMHTLDCGDDKAVREAVRQDALARCRAAHPPPELAEYGIDCTTMVTEALNARDRALAMRALEEGKSPAEVAGEFSLTAAQVSELPRRPTSPSAPAVKPSAGTSAEHQRRVQEILQRVSESAPQ